jgi:hypothetical protein
VSKHPIVHVEIASNEPSEAGKFYAALFGWETMSMPVQGSGDYHGFRSQEQLGGGFSQIGEYTDAGDVVIYVGTADVDASLARATELGATTLVPKTEIPGMGFMGIFRDPTGNKIGLWTDTSGQG